MPVPDGPANSAVIAVPRRDPVGHSPRAKHGRPPAHLVDQVAEQAELVLGEHDVLPRCHRLDALRERVQTRPGLGSAGRPQAFAAALRAAGDRRRLADGDLPEIEFSRQQRRLVAKLVVEHGLPDHLLLVRGRPRDIDDPDAAASEREWLAAAYDQHTAGVLQQRLCPRHLLRAQVRDFDVQRQRQQDRLPLPQPHQIAGLVGAVRDAIEVQLVELVADPVRRRRAQPVARERVDADDLDDRRALGAIEYGQGSQDLLDCLVVTERQRVAEDVPDRPDEMRQPVVERIQPFEEPDDPLIRAQPGRGQRFPVRLVNLDQPPVAQRPVRGDRLPVRLRQRGQRQPEGRERGRGIAAGRSAARCHTRVELGRGGEQQRQALEQ